MAAGQALGKRHHRFHQPQAAIAQAAAQMGQRRDQSAQEQRHKAAYQRHRHRQPHQRIDQHGDRSENMEAGHHQRQGHEPDDHADASKLRSQ